MKYAVASCHTSAFIVNQQICWNTSTLKHVLAFFLCLNIYFISIDTPIIFNLESWEINIWFTHLLWNFHNLLNERLIFDTDSSISESNYIGERFCITFMWWMFCNESQSISGIRDFCFVLENLVLVMPPMQCALSLFLSLSYI